MSNVTELCISVTNNSQLGCQKKQVQRDSLANIQRVHWNTAPGVHELQYRALYLATNNVRGRCFQMPHFPPAVFGHLQLGAELLARNTCKH